MGEDWENQHMAKSLHWKMDEIDKGNFID